MTAAGTHDRHQRRAEAFTGNAQQAVVEVEGHAK